MKNEKTSLRCDRREAKRESDNSERELERYWSKTHTAGGGYCCEGCRQTLRDLDENSLDDGTGDAQSVRHDVLQKSAGGDGLVVDHYGVVLTVGRRLGVCVLANRNTDWNLINSHNTISFKFDIE